MSPDPDAYPEPVVTVVADYPGDPPLRLYNEPPAKPLRVVRRRVGFFQRFLCKHPAIHDSTFAQGSEHPNGTWVEVRWGQCVRCGSWFEYRVYYMADEFKRGVSLPPK